MSSHNYAGCQDSPCELCDAYAAGKDKARWELGQPDAVLICSCLLCKHTRRVAVTHFAPTSNPAEWDADMKACWESFQVCDCGPCEHIRSKQRQAKLDTGELSE